MPGREIPLVTGQTYHLLNRGIGDQPIFLNSKDYTRGLKTLLYYQNSQVPLRYSFFLRLPKEQRREILTSLEKKKDALIDIIAYCLMPNHFHLLCTQRKDNGISIFMGNFANSYTRYFNTKRTRRGPIFQGKFKAIRIETDEQLLHVSRYIHLNPYTSYLVKTLPQLEQYPYSSFGEYITPQQKDVCQKELILSHFPDGRTYKNFVFDQADYQRQLEKIKHLALET